MVNTSTAPSLRRAWRLSPRAASWAVLRSSPADALGVRRAAAHGPGHRFSNDFLLWCICWKFTTLERSWIDQMISNSKTLMILGNLLNAIWTHLAWPYTKRARFDRNTLLGYWLGIRSYHGFHQNHGNGETKKLWNHKNHWEPSTSKWKRRETGNASSWWKTSVQPDGKKIKALRKMQIPSGKRLHNYGVLWKITFFHGKTMENSRFQWPFWKANSYSHYQTAMQRHGLSLKHLELSLQDLLRRT